MGLERPPARVVQGEQRHGHARHARRGDRGRHDLRRGARRQRVRHAHPGPERRRELLDPRGLRRRRRARGDGPRRAGRRLGLLRRPLRLVGRDGLRVPLPRGPRDPGPQRFGRADRHRGGQRQRGRLLLPAGGRARRDHGRRDHAVRRPHRGLLELGRLHRRHGAGLGRPERVLGPRARRARQLPGRRRPSVRRPPGDVDGRAAGGRHARALHADLPGQGGAGRERHAQQRGRKVHGRPRLVRDEPLDRAHAGHHAVGAAQHGPYPGALPPARLRSAPDAPAYSEARLALDAAPDARQERRESLRGGRRGGGRRHPVDYGRRLGSDGCAPRAPPRGTRGDAVLML
mmetsp:Transcript_13985/g.41667  ORF Transcript_13985/g.41667 Transcript_13985/m.41667 type:complete len:345 (-) Transcript_13985:86-1120(-)